MRFRLTLLALVGLLSFSVDAQAQIFHRHKLLHGHGHGLPGRALPAVPSVINQLLGTTTATKPPTIMVSSDVVANIKQTEKNLQDASTTLSPLVTKYKLSNVTTDSSGNVTHIFGNHVSSLTPADLNTILTKLGKN